MFHQFSLCLFFIFYSLGIRVKRGKKYHISPSCPLSLLIKIPKHQKVIFFNDSTAPRPTSPLPPFRNLNMISFYLVNNAQSLLTSRGSGPSWLPRDQILPILYGYKLILSQENNLLYKISMVTRTDPFWRTANMPTSLLIKQRDRIVFLLQVAIYHLLLHFQ